MLIKTRHERETFKDFLCGMPAGDYVFQNMEYKEQIQKAAEMIEQAEYVLIGAGAGLSAAAGAVYGGDFFQKHFSEFIKKYGESPYMKDMYSAGFYPYPSEEAKWGYWSKQALLAGIDVEPLRLYRQLYEIMKEKKYYVLTTNVDEQFVKTGFDEDRIFATQGSYELIQCQRGCHPKTYHAAEIFRQMDQARKDCEIPKYMIPKCPVCGGKMEMNLRMDSYFVEDEKWHQAEQRFGNFLEEALDSKKNVLALCVGTGFNTPTIIRYPFENLVRKHGNVSLLRLNLNEAVIQESYQERELGINKDMAISIPDILKELKKL